MKKITIEQFIKRANKIHHINNYDYSKVVYVNNSTNINIFCNIHKQYFEQSPKSHCKGYGCRLCGIEKLEKAKKDSSTYKTLDFIKKVKKIHPINHYNYSKTIYVNSRTKVNIFCNIHKKEFKQSPSEHLKGSGCKECGIQKTAKSLVGDTSTFIKKAKKIHGATKYNYSKTIYLNSKKKVEIICDIHNSFFVTPNDHLSKKVGCQICGKNKTTKAVQERYKDIGKEHLETAKKVHNNIYVYSKVIIGCSKHGDFKMLLDSHAIVQQGCPKCGKERMGKAQSLKLDEFISRAIKKHGNLYSYKNIDNFINGKSYINIFCQKCNKYFKQQAKMHLQGSNCPKCANLISNPEKEIVEFIKSLGIEVIENTRKIITNPNTGRGRELDIFIPKYNLAIEFNGIYFHSSKFKDKNFHKEKSDACREKGIFLLHIFEDDFNYKKDLIFNRIKYILGKLKYILAEEIKLKIINSSIANDFLNKNYIYGETEASFYYGLFYDEQLVGTAGFLKNTKNNKYELVRYSSKVIVNGLEKILKEYKNNFSETLYTFVDNSFFNYQDYIKLGFIKIDEIVPDYKYVIKGQTEDKSKWQKEDIKIKLPKIYNENKNLEEMMIDAGIYKIYDCGKTKLEL